MGGGGDCTVRSTLNKLEHVLRGRIPVQWARSLYGEVKYIMGNGHMGTDRQTENITFKQLG